MLSNPPPVSGLHSRQRQHRRQNSTPSAFEAVKIAPLPTFQQQRQSVSHRRGLSLDTRRQQQPPTPIAPTTTLRQDYTTTVSTTTTNPGLSTTPQHVLREAQQQRIARPGHGQPTNNNTFSDDFLMSPQAPLHPQFMEAMGSQGQMPDLNGLPFDWSLNGMMKKNQTSFAGNQEFEFFGPDSALSTPTFMTFPDASPAGSGQGWISESETASTHSRRTSRRISNGIIDKVAKFEAMNGMDASAQRPATPPGPNMNGYFPPTPMETPHGRVKHEATPQQRPSRFSDDYDESMEETIKPIRGNRNSNRNSGIFQDLRQQAEAELVQTPPRANTMPMAFTEQGLRTPDFMNMTNLNDEFVKIEHGFDGLPTGRLSISSDMSSHPSPLASSLASLGGFSHHPFDQKPDLRPALDFDSQNTMMPHHTDSPFHMGSRSSSRHRRTDSIASIASAASIASINIEETKTDTGVTIDDIATYIEGPDPADGKWVCLYEDCKKRFGRKENIKSHVQTHLNDRQYQCPTCKKCFVRQHDLKRHAKIHTGIKPYPCQCGNSFARHDALTRHRQRGMCIGAFEGITRKVVKRGRPRKNRPDLEERREKSERTRRKNTKDTSTSSMSSQSGYSDSSAVNSPSNDFDNFMDDDQPFPDILDVAMGGDLTPAGSRIPVTTSTMNPSNLTVSTAPMPTPTSLLSAETISALSPGAGPGPAIQHLSQQRKVIDLEQLEKKPRAASPSVLSIHSQHPSSSPVLANFSGLPNLPSGTMAPSSPGSKSVASIYTHHVPCTPPELSASSSPPPSTAQSSSRFADMTARGDSNPGVVEDESATEEEGNLSSISDTSIGLGTTLSAHAAGANTSDDLLLQFQDGLVDDDALVGYGLVGVHHQGMMGMMSGKFGVHSQMGNTGVDVVSEADYDAAVNMNLFTDSDVFFGN
ncbi:metallothionein expression activator [Naviculisporaceae sp. PSN 640]